MKKLAMHSLVMLVGLVMVSGSCAGSTSPVKGTNIELTASTPGDPAVLAMLGIKPTGVVDFIRWHLVLRPDKTFTADLKYGESKPNTLGFKQDNFLTLTGKYTPGNIYTFTSTSPAARFNLVRLNDLVYHLLTSDGKMMVGNGGWGYCLNRVHDGNSVSKELPGLLSTASLVKDTATHLTYDGRTPCVELAQDNKYPVSDACFKLKWRIILNRDPVTLAPTTYILKTINQRADTISGTWTIIKGIPAQPNAIIYQLEPGKSGLALSFLVMDENVLLFLRKDFSLYVGNGDFSYSLNRNLQR